MKFGNTRIVRNVPAITASIYTAGWVIGGEQRFDGIGSHNGSGFLMSVALIDNGNQKPALTIMLFEGELTGTVADAGVFSPSAADIAAFCGKIDLATSDWVTINSKGYATKGNLWLPFRSKITKPGVDPRVDRRLSVVASAVGTPTPASTSDLEFIFGFWLD